MQTFRTPAGHEQTLRRLAGLLLTLAIPNNRCQPINTEIWGVLLEGGEHGTRNFEDRLLGAVMCAGVAH